MKRPIKPFVVEVRKGQKSQKKFPAAPETPSFDLFEEQPRESDALRRAEAALFGLTARPDASGASSRSGRILESIPEEATPPVEATPIIEGKRRGRPPGSRNKPKDQDETTVTAEPQTPKRRGRPPRIAEGAVRKVELTPELASAALESIARAGVARAPLPTRPGAGPRMAPVKQPRGPKRGKIGKEKPVGDAAAASAPPIWPGLDNVAASPTPAPVLQPRGPLDSLPRLVRIATEKSQGDPAALLGALRRPRAGERWKRRLRGAALVAYERRLKKSIATPR